MHHLCSIRREHGAALVIGLLLLVVLFVVGSGALTTSRIQTQIARNDTKGKQVLLAAEYALAVGENTVQQAWSERDLADKLTSLSGWLYGKQQQPAGISASGMIATPLMSQPILRTRHTSSLYRKCFRIRTIGHAS